MPQRKRLWHSDREKIFVRLSEPHIYIVVLTDGREFANKIRQNNKTTIIMNTDYRYQLESKRLTGHQPRKLTCPHCGKKKCLVRCRYTQRIPIRRRHGGQVRPPALLRLPLQALRLLPRQHRPLRPRPPRPITHPYSAITLPY